jgi:hypothetical protein
MEKSSIGTPWNQRQPKSAVVMGYILVDTANNASYDDDATRRFLLFRQCWLPRRLQFVIYLLLPEVGHQASQPSQPTELGECNRPGCRRCPIYWHVSIPNQSEEVFQEVGTNLITLILFAYRSNGIVDPEIVV